MDIQTIVFSKTVTLTDADIKTLPTLGAAILPNLPEGKIYDLVGGAVTLNWVVDYTNVDAACFMQFNLGSEQRPVSVRIPGFIFNNGASTTCFISPLSDIAGSIQSGQTHPTSDFTGDGLLLGCDNNGQSDFSGGDAGNTLVITICYTIIDLT